MVVMKKLILIILACSILFSLASCKKDEFSFDINEMAEKLAAEGVFEDKIEKVDSELVSYFYGVQNVSAVMYTGSGATAEEIAVFECADEDEAIEVRDLGAARLAAQADVYSKYDAEEVARLSEAVLWQNGKYVAVVVSADSAKALSIIESFKQ